MKIKEISARVILDSRKEETIEIGTRTSFGVFSASAPYGKSRGKHEAPAFIKNVEDDIKTIVDISGKITQIDIEKFDDLKKIEEIASGIGANSIFALETSILKALAFEQGKELWQVINPAARRIPHPVGNIIGGGMHVQASVKPDFQEFLVIPRTRKFVDDIFLMKKIHENMGKILEARKAKQGMSDENAWATNLGNEEVLQLLDEERRNIESETGEKIELGVDIAGSTFYSKEYIYKNPYKRLSREDQINYIASLASRFNLFYIEDPLDEEDFSGFAKFKEKVKCLVVGDDLTTSNPERFLKAVKSKSINAVIIKPNQYGSLVKIKKLVDGCKKFGIITIMSHRSGETLDNALADLAFAFQTEFIKAGAVGKERDVKLKRMIEIEKQFS